MYTKVFIKLLKQTTVSDFCFEENGKGASCEGVDCTYCPFNTRETLNEFIKELRSYSATCRCTECGTNFEAVITDCPVCNTLESVRLL